MVFPDGLGELVSTLGDPVFDSREKEDHVVVGRRGILDLFTIHRVCGVKGGHERSLQFTLCLNGLELVIHTHTPAMRLMGMLGAWAWVPSWMLWMSSQRAILGGLVSPVGFLERVSGALFLTPGTWTMRKRYRSVFSLRFLSLPLLMLSRDLSLKIFRSGLWSTAIIRLSHPSTKCRALSRASATVSASPSIGA